jgi:chromosome segregation ATPase
MAEKNNKKFGFVFTGLLLAFLAGGSLLCGQLLSERKCFKTTIAEDSHHIEKLSRDVKELSDGSQALTRRNGELKIELKYTQEKIRGQEIRIKRQEGTIKREEAKITHLEEESVKTKKDIDELKEGLYLAKEIIGHLTEKVEKLNNSVTKLEKDNKALEIKAILPQNP